MTARTLMLQGTFSSAGKSLLVTALCRIFARRGMRVAPFKSQNMSNNAAVCRCGAEIGRAQAVQAAAAGVEPTSDMNPVLLKPEAGGRSHVVVDGRPWKTLPPRAYYEHKAELWPRITAAIDRLRGSCELVIIEGAGSPAELNLHGCDLANMAVARYCRAPVLLAGDIDRGGVFAQLLGTLWLLPEDERALVRGLIVNKFRGDRSLFDDGVTILEQRGGTPVLGVVPFLPSLAIPAEDSADLDSATDSSPHTRRIDVAVVRLPHIANFDDFEPLADDPTVRLRYVHSTAALGDPDAVILPGTKSTIADFEWMESQGLGHAIQRLAQRGTPIVGICGGYQMLGQRIADPHGVESPRAQIDGLGLLPGETVFEKEKATHQVTARLLGGPGWLGRLVGESVQGYEIHMGHTTSSQPWLEILQRGGQPAAGGDGGVAGDGQIWGSYLHGLFANDLFRRAWLEAVSQARVGRSVNGRNGSPSKTTVVDVEPLATTAARFQQSLDRLADAVESALDMPRLEQIIWEN
ncbi:MAG TPA: cobyric acid synthase [Pirellulales bacterium]|jgi:adenosylcobyric acid synthase|nr:cobyric acid synthase [Pirellulales bacterium]